MGDQALSYQRVSVNAGWLEKRAGIASAADCRHANWPWRHNSSAFCHANARLQGQARNISSPEPAMKNPLVIKAALVALVFVILQIPLGMIGGIVSERAARQSAVIQDIAASSYARQSFAGPILSIPYTEQFEELVKTAKEETRVWRRVDRTLFFFPHSTDIEGTAAVSTKRRGLFKARVFNWQASIKGEFRLEGKTQFERSRADSRLTWGQPRVSLAIGDVRGLAGTPQFAWAGEALKLKRGSVLKGMESGVHAEIAAFDIGKPQHFPFTLQLALQGTEALAIAPLAADSRIGLKSDWPHPSFGGQFLPQADTQKVGSEGFDVKWAVSGLATNAQDKLGAGCAPVAQARKAGECDGQIEVRFIEPIDVYSLSDRAQKYGFLFIGLTIGVFLLFEVLKQWPIHPAQYFLVGMALAIFFLLLIALSEHVAFWIAYIAAAAACIALLGVYLGAVLGGAKRGLAFAAMLSALYASLYGLLVSEDNALLLGAGLVFGVLAAAMLLTRRVDWYRVGERMTRAQAA
jgi:inner membrane protein